MTDHLKQRTGSLGGDQDASEFWVIKFADADVDDLVFAGEGAEGAAKETYRIRQQSWNCHLFGPAERIAKAEAALAQKTRECEEKDAKLGLAQEIENGFRKQVEQLGRQVAEISKPITEADCVILGLQNINETGRKVFDRIIASRARTK